MQVCTATKADITAIKALIRLYKLDKCDIKPYHFNHRDIAVKAVNPQTGELIGFAWGGLMAKNKIVYIDKVLIHPDYARYGVSQMLFSELLRRATRIGVVEAFGVIRQDEFHDRSAKNALKFAFGADPLPFTYVYGTTERTLKELSHGR